MSLFELLISFWEDHFEENKTEAYRNKEGHVVYRTGDPLIDKWEQELEMGIEPDLLEGLPTWHREAAEAELAVIHGRDVSSVAQIEEETDGFSDDYTQME